jgi:hypothetical protein
MPAVQPLRSFHPGGQEIPVSSCLEHHIIEMTGTDKGMNPLIGGDIWQIYRDPSIPQKLDFMGVLGFFSLTDGLTINAFSLTKSFKGLKYTTLIVKYAVAEEQNTDLFMLL